MQPLPLLGGAPVPRTEVPAYAAKGFRPFFFLAALFAALVLPIWLLALAGVLHPGAYLDPMYWHAHEMVFGFATAVIAGFLLTAAGNWTGRETATGAPLLALAALWISARIAMLVPGAPHALVAALDLSFLPAVAITVGRVLVAGPARRNFVMLAVLVALFAANLAVHLDVLGFLPGWRRQGALVAVDVIALLIVLMAGRIFPMFTKNKTGDASVRSHPRLDVAAIVATALVVIADAAAPDTTAAKALALVAGVLVIARAVHWGTRGAFRDPMLWILHLGYAWVAIGLLLKAAPVAPPLATHALTVGAIGSLTLGMMARVALGHTGRPIVASRPIAIAFGLVTAAAVARVLVPLVWITAYRDMAFVAGTLWSIAFAIYVVVYAPIVGRRRIDGKPG